MIYILSSKDKNSDNHWISAISESKKAIESINIPNKVLKTTEQYVVEYDGTFPFYLLEVLGDGNTFLRKTRVEIVEFLKSCSLSEEEDIEYPYTIFVITQEWFSPKPGEDQMGFLNHIHVDQDVIDYAVDENDLLETYI